MKVAREYNAIVAQLTECQIAANEANEAFKTFQHDIIYMSAAASLGTFTDWPDKTTIIYTPVTGNYGAKLVDALTISMCEPGGKIDTYAIFLTDITYKRDSVTEQMEQTMALNNNGTDDPTIGIDEYDLYDAMMSRAYDLLWEKYKTLAFEWADKMLMDYISITYDAEYNNVSKESSPVYTTLPLADFSAKE